MSEELNFTEESYEMALIELFEQLGYNYVCGSDWNRNPSESVDKEELRSCLMAINNETYASSIPEAVYNSIIDEVIRKITNINEGILEQRNELFMNYLQNGVEVSYKHEDKKRTTLVKLIDFEKPKKNNFMVVNQYRMEEHGKIRCDMVVFVNALPLVVIELKSPSREETSEEDAFLQIKQYQKKCPSLFVYNAFSVISDMTTTKAGTITSTENRFMEWKSADGKYSSLAVADYNTFFKGIFPFERLLDILQNFICFDHKTGKALKVMGAYHQFFAVNKAVDSYYNATIRHDGKGGVFWHTQGSGKSFSMVFFVHKLLANNPGISVVVVTDRNDLDQQLYEQFAGCNRFLRQMPEQVGFELNEKGKKIAAQGGGRADLKKKLKGLNTGGIIFTTIQKFEEETGLLSERDNIVVITDEAHRTQYGTEHWDCNAEKMKKGFALLLHEALPNAVFFGFTGTPISERDRDTKEVFGDYIDVYDMTQAVADGATRPVYYESRVIKLKLDDEAMKQLDKEFENLAVEGASEEQINKARRDNSGIKGILCNDSTINAFCEDMLTHYEDYREHEITGKAMIVAYDKEAAVKIYKRILELRPNWTEKVHVVASAGNQDKIEWHDIITPQNNKEYAKLFKDNNSPMKIAIVVDMWLTGFDVPSLATMYVYKPMRGHNLMQAIARVNRVFPEKEGGLVVDYVGIAKALKDAMHDYTSRDQQQYGDPDIRKTAKVMFQEKLEICRDELHGFEYKRFYDGSNSERAAVINGGANFLLAPRNESHMKSFMRESEVLHNAETLCRSLLTREERLEAAFMDAVRVMILRFTQKGTITKHEINDRISRLLEQSIKSTGVINLFENRTCEFSLFDEKFLQEIRKMKEKNIAVQLLKKLIKERIKSYERTNVVQSLRFSELMNQALSNYLKGMLTNEEVIEELLKMADDIKKSENEGKDLGLTKEEKAFYDALSTPEGVKQAYSNDQFIALTKELTDQLRKNRTIDWNKKDSARARMRVLVKRLLRKYEYPPKGQEKALETVLAQCEKWADDDDNLI